MKPWKPDRPNDKDEDMDVVAGFRTIARAVADAQNATQSQYVLAA